MTPLAKSGNRYWIQLFSGPYDVEFNQPMLKNVVETIRQMTPIDDLDEESPILSKIDATRDLSGAFFATDNWRDKYHQLRTALTAEIDVVWRDNGNTFNSFIQYEGWAPEGALFMRVKFYFKTLALMQSETAAKSLGINSKGLYYPSVRMDQALKESKDVGQSRIEIT